MGQWPHPAKERQGCHRVVQDGAIGQLHQHPAAGPAGEKIVYREVRGELSAAEGRGRSAGSHSLPLTHPPTLNPGWLSLPSTLLPPHITATWRVDCSLLTLTLHSRRPSGPVPSICSSQNQTHCVNGWVNPSTLSRKHMGVCVCACACMCACVRGGRRWGREVAEVVEGGRRWGGS